MADARTNVEAIIEAYLRRRTRLNPTGIVHRRYSYRQPTSNHSRGQVLVAVPAGKISRSPWPPQNGCRTKPSAIQSMPGCNPRQRLPEVPSSNSCTTADGGLYESVYYFSAASPVTSFDFSALAFPRPSRRLLGGSGPHPQPSSRAPPLYRIRTGQALGSRSVQPCAGSSQQSSLPENCKHNSAALREQWRST
jgi:hypothetical protein